MRVWNNIRDLMVRCEAEPSLEPWATRALPLLPLREKVDRPKAETDEGKQRNVLVAYPSSGADAPPSPAREEGREASSWPLPILRGSLRSHLRMRVWNNIRDLMVRCEAEPSLEPWATRALPLLPLREKVDRPKAETDEGKQRTVLVAYPSSDADAPPSPAREEGREASSWPLPILRGSLRSHLRMRVWNNIRDLMVRCEAEPSLEPWATRALPLLPLREKVDRPKAETDEGKQRTVLVAYPSSGADAPPSPARGEGRGAYF